MDRIKCRPFGHSFPRARGRGYLLQALRASDYDPDNFYALKKALLEFAAPSAKPTSPRLSLREALGVICANIFPLLADSLRKAFAPARQS